MQAMVQVGLLTVDHQTAEKSFDGGPWREVSSNVSGQHLRSGSPTMLSGANDENVCERNGQTTNELSYPG
jgi:hypothetical protein